MSQPTPYTPTTDFSQQEANNASGRSTVNTAALDAEFANIETTVDSICDNLKLIQRDDGKLKDLSVMVHTLSPEVLRLMGGYFTRGIWTAATAYNKKDIVSNGIYTYACKTDHTSGGSFDGQYWTQFGFTGGEDAAQQAANAAASATLAAGYANSAFGDKVSAASSASQAAGFVSDAISYASSAQGYAFNAQQNATSAAASEASARSLLATANPNAQGFDVYAFALMHNLIVEIRAGAALFKDSSYFGYTSRSYPALTLTIPYGATLGTVSGRLEKLYVGLIWTGTAVEPVVCNASGIVIDENDVVNVSNMLSANSTGVIYGGQARTGVSIRIIGGCDITEATAGTWDTSPSRKFSGYFKRINSPIRVDADGKTSIVTNGTDKLVVDADTTGTYTFNGTAPRIRGEMSSGTQSSNVCFQSSTLNGATTVRAVPNGTATVSSHMAYNSADPDNSSYAQLRVSSTSTQVISAKVGTGTYLPLALNVSGADAWTLGTTGDVVHSYSKNGALSYTLSNTDAGATAKATSALTSNAGSLFYQKVSTAGGGYGLIGSTGGALYVGTIDNQVLALRTNNTDALTIDTNGNVLAVKATGGLGYGTGAGGSVTQTTSRTTTTPSINRPNGDITLFTAAGSATDATFTVPNNLVGIYDDIRITTRGGTNKYLAQVTNIVANTSFDVTFRTTGGTASDTPIFHFTIGKGSNA